MTLTEFKASPEYNNLVLAVAFLLQKTETPEEIGEFFLDLSFDVEEKITAGAVDTLDFQKAVISLAQFGASFTEGNFDDAVTAAIAEIHAILNDPDKGGLAALIAWIKERREVKKAKKADEDNDTPSDV